MHTLLTWWSRAQANVDCPPPPPGRPTTSTTPTHPLTHPHTPPPASSAVAPDQEALRQKLQAARDLLPRVQVPRDLKLKIRWVPTHGSPGRAGPGQPLLGHLSPACGAVGAFSVWCSGLHPTVC